MFVQSIRTGLPVAGARVELVGSNGLPVHSPRRPMPTAGAQLPRPADGGATREDAAADPGAKGRRHVVHAAPLERARSWTSRASTPAASKARESAQQLSTYLFSDRGIYRPGETAHLGVITRTADWKASLAGLPLDVEITDPRGLVVSRNAGDAVARRRSTRSPIPASRRRRPARIRRWPTSCEDERRRETLGSTSFRVQEFEPDRMKVQLDSRATAALDWLAEDRRGEGATSRSRTCSASRRAAGAWKAR